jgi:hypothetical protein
VCRGASIGVRTWWNYSPRAHYWSIAPDDSQGRRGVTWQSPDGADWTGPPGGWGRKKVEVIHPPVLTILLEVVDACTAGSPTDVLRWTSKSKTNLAVALAERGYRMAPNSVGRLLRDLGYSLQANRKDKEGRSPPERAAQVVYLNDQARAFLERGQPVISVDTKKKLRHEVARSEWTRR